jgi:glycine cleavage system aminomethyltransferase T
LEQEMMLLQVGKMIDTYQNLMKNILISLAKEIKGVYIKGMIIENIMSQMKNQKYKNSILDLKQLSVISVSGNDALLFLQGQLTNDLSLATLTQSIYAGFCNPKVDY